MFNTIDKCNNVNDFRKLAKQKLPSPIFHYIDGAADDEVTYERNTRAYEDCDLIPNVLSGIKEVDMTTTVLGQKLEMPIYCAPTALKDFFITRRNWCRESSRKIWNYVWGFFSTASSEEISKTISSPKLFNCMYTKIKA